MTMTAPDKHRQPVRGKLGFPLSQSLLVTGLHKGRPSLLEVLSVFFERLSTTHGLGDAINIPLALPPKSG